MLNYMDSMRKHGESNDVAFFRCCLSDAAKLYDEGVTEEEDGYKVIVDARKLRACHDICLKIVESRIPVLNIRAQAFYYLSAGRSDDVALDYLKRAVEASDKYEAQSGKVFRGREKFDKELQSMLDALAGPGQGHYGGVSLNPATGSSNGAVRMSYAFAIQKLAPQKLSPSHASESIRRRHRRANARSKDAGDDIKLIQDYKKGRVPT